MYDVETSYHLISSSSNSKSTIDISELNNKTRLLKKSINLNSKIFISIDASGENMAVYDRSRKKFLIYTIKGILKSQFEGKLDLSCSVFYQNRWIIGGDNSGLIYLYDVRKNKYKMCLNESASLNQPINEISISLEDNNLYLCHENGLISMYNIKSSHAKTLSYVDRSIKTISASPWQMEYLSSGSRNGIVSIYDVSLEKTVYKWEYHENQVNSISFSQLNDHLILSGGQDRRAVLSVTNEKKPQRIFNTDNSVTCCSMSDDKFFAFGESDGKISVYDLRHFNLPIHVYYQPHSINYLQFNFQHKHYNNPEISFNTEDLTSMSLLKEGNCNMSNNQSNNSVFSLDEDSQMDVKEYHNYPKKQLPNDTLNISAMPSMVSLEPKGRKQVQFSDGAVDKFRAASPQKNSDSSKPSSSAQPTVDSYQETQGFDYGLLKKMIDEGLRTQLKSLEDRMRTDILIFMVEQLGITEERILKAMKEQNEKNSRDNEELLELLRKYKYKF